MQNSVIDLILSSEELYESIKHSDEYNRFLGESHEIYKQLEKQLSAKQFEMFDKFAELSMDLECEATEAYFKEGIKIGVRFAIECLAKT